MCFWKTEKRSFVTPDQIHWTAKMNKRRLEGNLALNTVPETNELPKKVRLANTGSNSSKLRPTIPCLVNVYHWTRFLQCCWLLAVRRKLLCQHGNQQMRHQGSTFCEDQITSQKSEMNKLHSKYFSVSDWLKSHAWFITSCYRPNLEEFCDMKNDVNRVAKSQISEPLTEKTWGRV